MRNFEYYTPTRVIFGKDTHLQAGSLLKEYGAKKVLIHYGGQSAVRSGLISEISANLKEAGLEYVTLGGVVPNPHLSKVYEGINLCKKENVDFILAVGGGSVIDSSKAIGYGVANPDTDVWDFCLKKATPAGCLPIGVVLTIAASAAKSALHKAGQVVLEGHIQHCVRDGIEHGDADKTIANFTKAVERFANMK